MSSKGQRIFRQAKDTERRIARWFLEHDGVDPAWENITTSTGRTGHITDLQFDAMSKHYCIEVKNIVLPVTIWRFWSKICDIAKKHGKEPVLILAPKNDSLKTRPALHVITAERHAQLLEAERRATYQSSSDTQGSG